ncbi:MAG: DUF5671 domain-containing protein [Candidatus Staskawiczbacteria bacterium]|jgi:hypothetical protein
MEENIQIQTPKRNIPRDLFLHLLAIVTLYWSAITFTTMLWQFINYILPENLGLYNSSGYSLELIRFTVSSLFIVFPLFIIVSWYLNKIYRREAVVRESKIRKWLLYLTLFIAALVVVGDLVAVINNLLGGETTVRFILKALSILLVAGFVFGYYFDDVRKETPSKLGKPFAWVAGALVLAAIIGAFFIIGSPNSARLNQFDQQKIYNLQDIQGQVVYYYQRKAVLPNSLSDLDDPISGYIVPIDSQLKTPYEYKIIDANKLSFELCATFNVPTPENQPTPAYYMEKGIEQNWNHQEGRACFTRTIDKQLYPLINTIK